MRPGANADIANETVTVAATELAPGTGEASRRGAGSAKHTLMGGAEYPPISRPADILIPSQAHLVSIHH
jgi:hypothetical protein